MAKITLRGRKLIQNSLQVITLTSLFIGIAIVCIWMITCEFQVEHNTDTFKTVMISFMVCFIISSICDLFATKIRRSIRREIKAKKAKTWWLQ